MLIFAGCVPTSTTETSPIAPARTPEEKPSNEPTTKPAPESKSETTSVKAPETSGETSSVSGSATDESKGPLLSDALTRNCNPARASGDFGSLGLTEGEIAVDFTLKDVHGKPTSLAGLLSEKPVVMVFGSFT